MSKVRLKQFAQDGASGGQHLVWSSDNGVWQPETVPTVRTPRQEPITTEVVTGTDTALADPIPSTPVSFASLRLYLNGVFQVQGVGNDYTIAGTTITWLASTGTAVDMDTADELIAVYES